MIGDFFRSTGEEKVRLAIFFEEGNEDSRANDLGIADGNFFAVGKNGSDPTFHPLPRGENQVWGDPRANRGRRRPFLSPALSLPIFQFR